MMKYGLTASPKTPGTLLNPLLALLEVNQLLEGFAQYSCREYVQIAEIDCSFQRLIAVNAFAQVQMKSAYFGRSSCCCLCTMLWSTI